MKCLILAAGCATRLRPHTEDLPKTLLRVGGVPILRRTITSMLRLGVDEFVIGTGHLEHLVHDAVAEWFPELEVTFVSNPDFRTTNNAYSLLLTRHHVESEDFILLDGDVVFDLSVLQQLFDHGDDCLAVRSAGGIGFEEVKVTADTRGRILEIGKHLPVHAAMGESVGIEVFSKATSRLLFAALEDRVHDRGLVNEYYEAAFQQIIDNGVALRGVDIGARYAAEIDTYEDLLGADQVLSRHPFEVAQIRQRVAG